MLQEAAKFHKIPLMEDIEGAGSSTQEGGKKMRINREGVTKCSIHFSA